jgi:opacity protein-like surface antigen
LKGHLLAGVAVAALIVAGPALAADLPLKAPPKLAPWTWSGFYLGGHAGYGWSHDPRSVPADDPFFLGKFPGFGVAGYDGKGWLAGFHAGANWQDGRVVGGLEIDLSATGIQGSSTATAGPVFVGGPGLPRFESGDATNSGRFEWLGSARARLGYLATPDVLLYGTGGLAWTHYTHDENLRNNRVLVGPPPELAGIFSSVSSPNWRFGWVAGIGGEMRLFNSNWLARLEYLHYDFGRSDTQLAAGNFTGPWPRNGGNLTADVVRAGLSYKFDPDRFALGYTGAEGAITPVRDAKAPLAAVPWTWAGFYLGGHGGYGWADDPFNNKTLQLGQVTFPPLSGVDSRGFVAGFHAGANWQSRSVVGGLELDISGTGIKGSTANTAGGLRVTQNDKFDPLGSVRARLGYLVTPSVLLYGTGGLGWTQFTTVNEFPGFVPASLATQSWLFGWVAGVGLEARLGNTNWLGRVEYLHYDFGNSGSFTQFTPAGVVATASSSGHLTVDVVRAGVSYKLNWPDPAGAGRSVIIAKAPVAQPWSWSGFYVGGHGGYGWGNDPSTQMVQPATVFVPQAPLVILGGVKSQGYVAGFQAGANWQSREFVGGLEIDLSKTGIKGSAFAAGDDGGGGAISGARTEKFDLLGSARARLGYLVRPDLLLYGSGGLAWTRLEHTVTNTNPAGTTITSTPSWRAGWVAGAGGQLRLWNSNWIARLEYLHYDFGKSARIYQGFIDPNSPPTGLTINTNTTSGRLTSDVIRAGIDYKFD